MFTPTNPKTHKNPWMPRTSSTSSDVDRLGQRENVTRTNELVLPTQNDLDQDHPVWVSWLEIPK